MISAILPASVAAAEAVGELPGAALLPEEEAALSDKVVEKRRRDFTLARTCARRALGELGVAPVPILPGPQRQPLWPAGIVGSITHCPGYCAAAVARRAQLAAIGIDAEVHEALPDGVLGLVSLAEERAWLDGLSGDGVHWDRVLFSAKESVYKAWFPLTERWLGFEEALVTVDPTSATFHARLLVAGPTVDGRAVSGFDGRLLVRDGLVLTAVTLPAEG